MTAQSSPSRFALPYPNRLAQDLFRLHQRLAGELEKVKDGEEPLMPQQAASAAMRQVRALLGTLGVNFDARVLKPRRTRIQIGPLDYGGMRRGILKTLKANGDWMTYSEIVDVLVRQHRLVLTVEQRRHFVRKIREATHALKRFHLVEPQLALRPGSLDPQEQRWRLVSPPARAVSLSRPLSSR